MKQSIKDRLQSTLQGEVLTDKEHRQFYSVDASSYQIIPDVIVVPKNEKDIINTIKIAKKFRVPVTVRGAGTGLVGSGLNKGIIIDMKKFDSCVIQEHHAIVGPGISKGELDKELEKRGKFFPPNPSIGSFCSIGGMVGNNSSGSRSLKYGSVIDNVSEITLIDGNGRKITLPKDKTTTEKILKITKRINKDKFPKVTKNSSGYRIDKIVTNKDIHKIIIGSEGTLGIITSVKLKIKNNPRKRILFVLGYKSIKECIKNCIEINKINPSTMEFVDKTTLNQIKFKFDKKIKCILFVELDESITSNKKKISKIVSGDIIQEITKNQDMIQWWNYRDASLHYSLKSIKKQNRIPHIIEDAAVSLETLPEIFTILNKINKKYRTKSIAYGHAGNGNIHIKLASNRLKREKIKEIAKEYFDEIIKRKGTITAEHGDGLARSEFIKKQYGAQNYQLFIEIKEIFDPKNILNPGKIISKKSTILRNIKNV